MAFYLDTSALVKLVVQEAETSALRAWASAPDRTIVTSDITRTELMRAVRRIDAELAPAARSLLDAVTVIQLSTATYDTAGRLEPDVLRSLDALHLAVALELGDDLEGFVAYDERLSSAAARAGLVVVAPT